MQTSLSSTRPRRQVISEACAWFIEFRAGDATAGTRDRFAEWLRHSPEHIQAYLEVAAAWAELPTCDPQGRIDLSELIERARSSRDEDVVVPLTPRGAGERTAPATLAKQPRRKFRALAAGVALVTLVAGAAAWLTLYGAETYTTDIGEQRTIRLSDNSIVDLNARSRIRVRFSKATRTVELLEGQALFHVTKDSQRPFIVNSDGMAVRAVGTQFDVYRRASGMVVTVLEGRVAVRSASKPEPAFLSAGEQLTVTPAAAARPHRADVSAATAWVQRRLVFEETPLAEVAEEFNRYSIRRLVIDDPDLAHQPISGIYSSSDPSSLIGFLRAQPTLEVNETEREIRVTRRDATSGR